MCKTLRKTDMHGERIVKDYLIRYFYERIRNDGILPKILDYRAIDSVEQQLNGIDTIVYLTNGTSIIIDEKCALKYINTHLPTFAFEIQWNRYGEVSKGWLVNNALQTQYYFVMWIRGVPIKDSVTGDFLKSYDYVKKMTVETLSLIELYAINKHKLLKYLADNGLTIDEMQSKATWLVKNNEEQYKVNADLKYFYSNHLAEKPVNIVISKELLKLIADSAFEITPNTVKRNGRIIYEAPKKF